MLLRCQNREKTSQGARTGHSSLLLSQRPALNRADASSASRPSKFSRLDELSISLLRCSGPTEATFGVETGHYPGLRATAAGQAGGTIESMTSHVRKRDSWGIASPEMKTRLWGGARWQVEEAGVRTRSPGASI